MNLGQNGQFPKSCSLLNLTQDEIAIFILHAKINSK